MSPPDSPFMDDVGRQSSDRLPIFCQNGTRDRATIVEKIGFPVVLLIL